MSAWASGVWAPGAWAGTVWAESASTGSESTSLSAAVQMAATLAASLSTAIQTPLSANASVDAALQATQSNSALTGAAIQQAQSAVSALQAAILAGTQAIANLDVQIEAPFEVNSLLSLAVRDVQSVATSLHAAIMNGLFVSAGLSSGVQFSTSLGTQLNMMIQEAGATLSYLDAVVSEVRSLGVSVSTYIAVPFSTVLLWDVAVSHQALLSAGLSVSIDASNFSYAGERNIVVPADTPTLGGLDTPPTKPRFYIRSGSTLDYTFKWAPWLRAIPDSLESFTVTPGTYLSVEGNVRNGADVRSFVTAADIPRRRLRTTLACTITTVGVNGLKRTETVDCIFVITKP